MLCLTYLLEVLFIFKDKNEKAAGGDWRYWYGTG